MSTEKSFRLVTRSDFDGLVCAMILKELKMIDDIKFVHPKDMQDGKIAINDNDITTNLPYVEGVHLAFDHHSSEIDRIGKHPDNHIIDQHAPSAARVVYDYYGGANKLKQVSEEIMAAVDKGDAAQFNEEEILHPKGWDLMNYLMDARTGLGRFRNFTVSNYQLMMQLIDYCMEESSIDKIMQLQNVAERKDLYFEHESRFREQLKKCATVHKNLVVVDLRDEETIWAGNRFMIYALFPQCNISMHVLWGLKKQNVALPIGKSIITRTSNTDIGKLALKYGGGGHENAGTCQVAIDQVDDVVKQLINQINVDG